MGNVFGFLIVIASIVVGVIFGAVAGGVTFVTVAYLVAAVIIVAYYVTMPPKDSILCQTMPPAQADAFRTYHLIVRTPGASMMFSALINLLRLAGVVWGILLLIKGSYVMGALALALFPITSLFVVRFDPYRYMTPGIKEGNAVAIEQMGLIERAKSRYQDHYSAI